MSPPDQARDAAGVELRALVHQLHEASGLTYEQVAERAHVSRSTVGNYLTKPAGRPTHTLEQLLGVLGACQGDRARAMELHRQTLPRGVDPVEVGWRARARAVGCTVWSMAGFTAAEATVHTAIGRRHDADQHTSEHTPPAYVPRAHDLALRADITAAAAGTLTALIVLRGTSSTGKTRSLFEAVHQRCPGWTVIRPRTAAAARELPESGLLDRPLVVWLNELQGFLGPNGEGLSLDVLRDLFAAATAPVVLVGTLWPDKLRAATNPGDEYRSDTRDLLDARTPWVRWHKVAPTLTTPAEQAAARKLAATDPRLARAVDDPDRVGFAQTLAGAHELLEHYHRATPTMRRLLLDAAADARRLGHTHALTAPLLEAIARGLWDNERTPTLPPEDWFPDALRYATQALRSDDGVRALTPINDDDTTGYDLADYLEQHLTRTRRIQPVPDATWTALLVHTHHAADLTALARAATRRGRLAHAEALHQGAAAGGDPVALIGLARLLNAQPGREGEVEQVYRDAAAGGDPGALIGLARWLGGRPGREGEVEQAYRDAVAAGVPFALIELAHLLDAQPGREGEVEQAYHDAVAAGVPLALDGLVGWLGGRPGREGEVEQVYRDAVAAGVPGALDGLARWLGGRPGREGEVEQVYRDAVAAGDPGALDGLARWLGGQPGREGEVEQAYRDALAPGDPLALIGLVGWLGGRPGREGEVEQVYRDAVAAGVPGALNGLAGLLDGLARWLGGQPGREGEAEQAYRDALAANVPGALDGLARWLGGRPGREGEAEQVYRDAVAAGVPGALDGPDGLAGLDGLARWLGGQPGREGEAEQAYRDAAAAGSPFALSELVRWLGGQTGREAEVELIRRVGLNARGHTAEAALAPHPVATRDSTLAVGARARRQRLGVPDPPSSAAWGPAERARSGPADPRPPLSPH